MGGFLHGAGEDLAGRHVPPAVGVDPGATGDRERQVGVVGLDANRPHARHEFDQARLAATQLLPGRPRVGPIEKQGADDELFVLRQGHPGVGRVSRSRKLGQHPPSSPRGLADRIAGSLEDGLTTGVDPAHRARVALGRDPDPGVHRLSLEKRGRRQELQLCVRRLLEKKLVQSRQFQPYERVRAPPDDRLVTGFDQRPPEELGAERDRLARLDLQAVIDQQIGPALDHGVLQSSRSSRVERQVS